MLGKKPFVSLPDARSESVGWFRHRKHEPAGIGAKPVASPRDD
jgi:hypothetical protein